MEVSSCGSLTKFIQNVAISGGPFVTNHCSPLVMFKCSRSDGYGILTLALGHSHNLPFHFLAARGQNLEIQSPKTKCQCRGLNSHSLRGSSVKDQSSTSTCHASILQVFSRTHIQIMITKLVSGFQINGDC
jgi:hypothetical protein